MIRLKGLTGFSVLLLSSVLLGASSSPRVTAISNTQPDLEDQDSFTLEEGGLELPMGEQPTSSRLDNGTFDFTQGSVDQAHDFYAKGTLVNASNFGLEGDGYLKIFQPRDRGWATYDLTMVVGAAASELAENYPDGERAQIGDVCAQTGGQLAQHVSHQNGLDADIAYMRVNHREQDPTLTTGFDEIFVQNGQVTDNLDQERVWRFVNYLHDTGRLVRIFMDPVIKAALCNYAVSIGEYDSGADVLRRIRPLALHQNHMHVRITCPQMSPECQAQADPPPGTACADVIPGFNPNP